MAVRLRFLAKQQVDLATEQEQEMVKLVRRLNVV
jgi:hypothetical protein